VRRSFSEEGTFARALEMASFLEGLEGGCCGSLGDVFSCWGCCDASRRRGGILLCIGGGRRNEPRGPCGVFCVASVRTLDRGSRKDHRAIGSISSGFKMVNATLVSCWIALQKDRIKEISKRVPVQGMNP
jgi:hypothetical protein